MLCGILQFLSGTTWNLLLIWR